jgi:hypothetical protein
MECAICYEKFFRPKTHEEFERKYEETVKNNDYNEIQKFLNLLITSKHNTTYSCSTPYCECLVCGDCWIKITHNGKSIDEMTEDDMSNNYYFKCPYCRQVDWKDCMNNIFDELQIKVLGKKGALEPIFRRWFPDFYK